MRFGWLAAASAMVSAVPAGAQITYTQIAEVEPNDNFATAQIVPLSVNNSLRIVGSLEGTSTAFIDFFRVTTGSLACQASVPTCYTVFVDTDGVNLNGPYLGIFDVNGNSIFSPGNVTSGSIGSLLGQTYTIGVRRNALSPSSNYNLFLRMTYAYAPEPAAWAMMILGMGVVGGMMRRRRTTMVYA